MLAGLKLADHPGDTIAGFHVFNSPLAAAVGLASRKPHDLGRFSSQTREHIAQEGIAGLLARWTGLIAASCNEDNLRRLWQLVQFAQDQESLGFGRLSAFVQSVTQAQVQEPTPAKVRVMTIYKSKGLEFDIVVMPQLDKQLARVEKLCLVLRDSPASPTRAVFRSVNSAVRKLVPDEVNEAYLSELSSRLTDDLCCLYVGMTRARYALHLLAPIAKQTKAGTAAKPRSSYLTVLEAAFSIDHNQTLKPGKMLYQIGNPDWDDKAVSDVSAPTLTDHQMSAMAGVGVLLPKLKAVGTSGRSLPSVSPSSLEDGASVRVADLLALEKPVNRRRGTLFHRWFEQIDYLHPEPTRPTAEQLRACSADLTLGVPEEDLSQWLGLFLKLLDNPLVINALGKPAPDGGLTVELWREHDFVVYDEGKILRGQFDRVLTFRDASGKPLKAELLDFKTDRVTDENVGQVVAGYRPQIKAYIRGLSRLLGLDESAITGRLLFVGGEPRVEVVSG
jgi:ATP-dependent exoDNAse (exonuclease V) beta subunit